MDWNKYLVYLIEKISDKPNMVHSNLKLLPMIFSIAIKRESIGADSDPFKNVELKAVKQPAIPF